MVVNEFDACRCFCWVCCVKGGVGLCLLRVTLAVLLPAMKRKEALPLAFASARNAFTSQQSVRETEKEKGRERSIRT